MVNNDDQGDSADPPRREYSGQSQSGNDSNPIFPSLLTPQPSRVLEQQIPPPKQTWVGEYPTQSNQQLIYNFDYNAARNHTLAYSLLHGQESNQPIPPSAYPSQLLPGSTPQEVMAPPLLSQSGQAHPSSEVPVAPNPAYLRPQSSMYVLEQYGMPVAQSQPVDPEAQNHHKATGESIIAPGSVPDSNGRTYQGYREGKYFLPNDAAEQDRLDFQHAGTSLILNGKLAWAPIQTPKWVLDIATGTGIWAHDFAEQHPESNVVGSDLTPIQPPARVPNLSFVVEDAEEAWVHEQKFDYIHARYVYTCFDHPQAVIRSAFEFLNPGGWMEFQDASPLLQSAKGPAALDGNPLRKLIDLAINGAALQGREILVSQHYKRWMEEAGFVDVHEVKVGLPINDWHPNPQLKRAGLYHSRMMLDNLRGIVWKMVQGNGLSDTEIDDMVALVKPQYRNLEIQGFFDFYVVYGRKPFSSELS